MKQKPFCFQCCRTLIFPGSTARSFCGRTGNYDPPWQPPPSFGQASLFISACEGQASREPIQSFAAAVLMIWLHFRVTCRRVYNWKVCRVNRFCLTNAKLGDICPSACHWCWNEGNNGALCWCPSVVLVNSLPALHQKAKEKLYKIAFLSFNEWSWVLPQKKALLSLLKLCATCLSEFVILAIHMFIIKKSSEGFHLTLWVPFLLTCCWDTSLSWLIHSLHRGHREMRSELVRSFVMAACFSHVVIYLNIFGHFWVFWALQSKTHLAAVLHQCSHPWAPCQRLLWDSRVFFTHSSSHLLELWHHWCVLLPARN